MIYVFNPRRALLTSLFWCGVWGMFIYLSVRHTPHAGAGTRAMLIVCGFSMLGIAVFRGVTALKWLLRNTATYYTEVWGPR